LALPGKVLEVIDPVSRLARVDVLGTPRVINLSLLDAAAPGDWVLVHTGFALERITEADAAETVRLFAEIQSSLGEAETAEEEEAAL
jgi:hydrogenase expression/formation protein HypC